MLIGVTRVSFIIGLGIFLAGLTSNIEFISLPMDFRTVTFTVFTTVVPLDVLLMGVGAFIMLVSLVFRKLSQ